MSIFIEDYLTFLVLTNNKFNSGMDKKIRILAFGATAFSALYAQQKPNIVLIYADDIGYGDLSCYGAARVQTPHVDALANNGVRFRNAHSAAATSTPSRYGLFTGEYPWRRKGTGIAAGDAALIIKPDRYTLPKMMKEAGYATGAVGKWHLGMGAETGKQNWNERVSPGPAEIGFDYSYIMAATGDRVPCVFMENQRTVGLDPKDPIEVSYTKNFPGEPTGKDNPELLTKLKPSHGHDMAYRIHEGRKIGPLARREHCRQHYGTCRPVHRTKQGQAVFPLFRNQRYPCAAISA